MSRKNFNDFLAKTLASPDFQRAFAQVSAESATRPVRPCRSVVMEVPEAAKSDDFRHVTPGTVTAFVAQEGEPLLARLTEAVKGNKGKDFNAIVDQIEQMQDRVFKRITESLLHPESRPHVIPSFAEISYANKTLVGHLHVDDELRVNVHPFPYNGGYLDHDRFSMIEYYRANADTPLTCLLLIRRPQLSEIEREALRLVPSGSATNVARSPCDPLTPALLLVVAIATPYAAEWLLNEFVNFLIGDIALAAIPDEVLESREFKDRLKSLPPEVTAAELLRLRTDILLRTPLK